MIPGVSERSAPTQTFEANRRHLLKPRFIGDAGPQVRAPDAAEIGKIPVSCTHPWVATASLSLLVAALAGCGSGAAAVADTLAASASAGLVTAASDVIDSAALAAPSFHTAPLILDPPKPLAPESGADGPVFRGAVPDSLVGLGTRNLLAERIYAASQGLGSTAPTAPKTLQVYTPSQIRASYGLNPVPNSVTNLSADAAASLGAGQTIYIVSAFHDENTVADLARFNSQFGLPQCRRADLKAGDTTLPAAGKNECVLSFVYFSPGRALATTPPGYDASWAQEVTLDLQWAHATAPLARLVVIEGVNALANTMADGVAVANKFGPGVVSMSWVASEGSFVQSFEPLLFNATRSSISYPQYAPSDGMTYVAAAGDFGPQGNWPATSPSVLAVGGTSLDAIGNGTRTESTWSSSGGSFSAYFSQPAYQSGWSTFGASTISYQLNQTRYAPTKPRGMSDVSFNANPYTGQYTAFTDSTGAARWYSMGGTSIGTPQWAGIIAIANARRALIGKPTVGKFHSTLYASIGPGLGSAGNSLKDITTGSTLVGGTSVCS